MPRTRSHERLTVSFASAVATSFLPAPQRSLSAPFSLGPGPFTTNNTDQRGFARPNDLPGEPNGSGGDGSDIGAFEFYGQSSSPECSDGADNDGDTLVDFPADPGCANADDTDETDQGPVVTCNGKTATVVGTPGVNDNLIGTDQRDVIAALDGDDKVNGAGGNDLICGGKGKDKLKGGDGNDDIFGEGSIDRLSGGPGNDDLDGGPAKDTCNGGGQRNDKLKSC